MEAKEGSEKGKQNHILRKVRKISLAMDKREFRIFSLILILLFAMIGLLVYYFL